MEKHGPLLSELGFHLYILSAFGCYLQRYKWNNILLVQLLLSYFLCFREALPFSVAYFPQAITIGQHIYFFYY